MSNVLSCTILPYPSNRTNIPLGPWCAAQSKNTWWCWMKTPPHHWSEHLADTNQPAGTSSSGALGIVVGTSSLASEYTDVNHQLFHWLSLLLLATWSVYLRRSLIRHRNCWFQSGHSHLVVESLGRRGNRARCCGGLSVILFGVCLVIVSSVTPCSSWLLVGAGFVCTSAHEHSLVTMTLRSLGYAWSSAEQMNLSWFPEGDIDEHL